MKTIFVLFILSAFLRMNGQETINLNTGEFVSNYQTKNDKIDLVLDGLNNHDTLTINYFSQGCFHTRVSKIIIVKNSDKFYATLNEPNSQSKKLNSITLTPEKIAKVRRFISNLKSMNGGGCTTEDSYTIKTANFNKVFTDRSCALFAYDKLLKNIFS